MPTPDFQRGYAHPTGQARRAAGNPDHSHTEWRCTRCDKLLGIRRGGQLHLRFARGHEYFVSLPAVASCRGCGTLNKAPSPAL